MKKSILALLLGGAVAVGAIAHQAPATAQAAGSMAECDGYDSDAHIKSSQVAIVDGQLAVTIDIEFEHRNAYFSLYVYEEQLEKKFAFPYDTYRTDYEPNVARLEVHEGSGTYTFPGLTGDKTYYVYCNVEDTHGGPGEDGDPESVYHHFAAYLGSSDSGSSSSGSSSSGSSSSGSEPSDNGSSGSNSSGSGSSDSSDESAESSYEDMVADQIQAAQPGSTIAMEKGVTTLSNSTMKELAAKGDVSLKLEFTYENKEYVIIIPAGAALDNDIPWYGPLYLAQHFGNSAGTAAAGAGGTYEVKSGDSLSRIASANNMTLKQLLAKNPQIKNPDKIVPGQKINR